MAHLHHHEQDPIAILMEERRIIERAINMLEKVAARLDTGKQVELTIIKNLIDFFRNFADRCHHGKEEKILFQTFSEHGIPVEGEPIGVMLFEHEKGRKAVKAMAEAASKIEDGDWTKAALFSKNAKNYAQLLTQHIYKEDNILYPMGGRLLSQEERKDFIKKFEKVEKEEIGGGLHEKYIKLIEELETNIL